MRAFDTLGYVLESVLTGLEMTARTREHLALILWPDIVGEKIAGMTAVQSVRSGVLYVDVEASAWAQELQMYRADLTSRVNAYLGAGSIRDIQFRTRTALKPRAPVGRSSRTSTRAARGVKTPDIQLSLDECREIADTARKVQEPELREALSSTMASYRRLERWMLLQGWRRCARCQALFNRPRGCPFCRL
jgi:predicted nucleic acid-binding Zn ribbon protein